MKEEKKEKSANDMVQLVIISMIVILINSICTFSSSSNTSGFVAIGGILLVFGIYFLIRKIVRKRLSKCSNIKSNKNEEEK